MEVVNVQEAKTHLSRLLAQVQSGGQVTISRAGVPVAHLVAATGLPRRTFGPMDFDVPEDFDEPLADDELAQWE